MYARWQVDATWDDIPITGYHTCFEFLMSDKPRWKPELIIHVRHTEKWVAEYEQPGEPSQRVYSPYEYRIAYVKPYLKPDELRQRSVYIIKLEPENEYRSYPVHMTGAHPIAYETTETNLTFTVDCSDDEELCQLYNRLVAIHTEWMRHFAVSPAIETFWFQDWQLPEDVIQMMPPFHNLRTYHTFDERGCGYPAYTCRDEITPIFHLDPTSDEISFIRAQRAIEQHDPYQDRPWT